MNNFDALKFLKDYNIQHTQDHHHCTAGRTQVHCPFCPGNQNYHLGIYLNSGAGSCWRCGKKTRIDIIQKLLNCAKQKAHEVINQYITDELGPLKKLREVHVPAKSISMPYGTGDLNHWHWRYLEKRKFDPQKLIDIYKIQGTGHLGEYRFRVIAPIFYEGKLVSYQGRDISNKSVRYMACGKKNEIVHHKNTLYAIDLVPRNTVVVVEGITDVWRLGPGAVATFGIEWSTAQVNLLRQFKKVWIWYDRQIQAQRKANALANELSLFTDVMFVAFDMGEADDPGDLPQEIANECMKELMG